MEEAKLEVRELKGLDSGHISIAMPAMYAAYYFPGKISAFMEQYPSLNILVQEEGTREVAQELIAGNIDLGVVTLDQVSDELEVFPLVDEEMVACVSNQHSFVGNKAITLETF